jgi:hypothetical protein
MRRYYRQCSALLFIVFLVAQFGLRQFVVRAASNCLTPDAPGCMYGLPTYQYQLLLGNMAAHPEPDVRQLPIDMNELGENSVSRIIGGSQPVYDAPDGNQIGVINAGFSYVSIYKRQGDWVMVAPGKWVPSRIVSSARSSAYSGVLIDQPLAYPMAWVLQPTRPSTIPGMKADAATPMLERYQRVNIFATITVDAWDWYLIGPGQWLEQRKVARVLPVQRPADVKGRWVAVDLYEQIVVAYEGDRMLFATLISSGLPQPNFSTNKGLFRIWARLRQDTMTGYMGLPDYYYLPNVPYVEYFDGGISLHGTYWHDGFGYRHSHGCVNMSVTDAHWMYDFTAGFYADTWVYVYDSKQLKLSMPKPIELIGSTS